MKVAVITGGTGAVGHFITRRLMADGWAVRNLSRHAPPPGAYPRKLTHFPFDLSRSPAPDAALTGARILIHAAFRHEPGRYRGGEGADPEGFRRANVEGTLDLFQAAKAAGIGRAVFLSSRAVYGDYPPEKTLTEDLVPRPDTLYGQVKLAVETELQAMASPDFTPISLRATGIYGAGPPGGTHKWAELFQDFLAGRPIAPRVGTEVHGDDLADAVARLIGTGRDHIGSGMFNVSDIVLDRHDLLSRVAHLTVCRHPLPPRSDAGQVNVMACGRLLGLGWAPGGMGKLDASLPQLLAAAT